MSSTSQLNGLRVLSLESRRAAEIAELIRRHGGEPVSAPSMREVALGDDPAAREFAERLAGGRIDVAIFLTGVGTRFLATAVATELPAARLREALSKIVTVARGPKPRAVLRELGVTPTISVPEPNTWRELLAAIDEHTEIAGRAVAVQEYGEENLELLAGLATRGASVLRVPIYRWALPEDLRPLREAIAQILGGRIDVALFTSATQVEHLFCVAGDDAGRLGKALERVVVASIGPICTEALERRGISVDFEPEHPKMGQLVLAAAERAPALRAAKRA